MAHTILPNGCKYSPIKVHPKNWQTANASVREDWYIWFRFHDLNFKDQYPKGKLIKKQGMNGYSTATERRGATRGLIARIIDELEQKGYNPITGQYVEEIRIEYEIAPETPFVKALEQAASYLKCEHSTMLEVNRIIRQFGKAANRLRYGVIPISEIKRKHLRFTLEHMERSADYWSATIFNNYRRYLSMLFTQLVELEAIEYNPVIGLKKQAVTRRKREVIKDEDRPKMAEALSKDFYPFWRYIQVFFHSGARNTEMLRLQGKHVDLKSQEITYLVKKGRQYAEVARPIKDIALPYWAELMKGCKAEDYVFSKGLLPGTVPIRPDQIKRRWRVHVKDKLGITADQYSLKHLNITEITEALDNAAAAKLAAHTSTRMVDSIYDVNKKDRDSKALKGMNNKFA